MMIIHREGPLYKEHAVRITMGVGKRGPYINPKEEVRRATDAVLPRMGCIYSFADGLIAARHEVYMHYHASTGRPERCFKFTRQPTTLSAFFFVGLAWGREEWPLLVDSLKRFVIPGERLRVLEHTGQVYASQLCLPLRLSWLIP